MPAEDGEERRGRVYLVGAGPGDPGLLTARALELIAGADVILYDRLVGPGALDGARADAELVFVGKEGGGASVPQERTEELMVRHARAGRTVLRLKGGDPFVFGRGGEEALRLREEGIAYEVVPGVTAGMAAPAYAGIPVTHRGLASAVALVTGHTRADAQDDAAQTTLDFPSLAAFPGTLVFYMGVRALPEIAAALLRAGRPADEPAAVVEAGTLPRQRTIAATLGTIAEAVEDADVKPPSITVVGPVAALARELAWLPPRPLSGKSVAVTRARAQASGLARSLAELGARVVEAPAISIRPLPGPPLDPSPYDLICVTSANGADAMFERLAASAPPLDARALAGARIAAVGTATAEALLAHGIRADVVPERSVAEGLVEALTAAYGARPASRALIARAAGGREALPDELRRRGVEVDVLELYETVAEVPAPGALDAAVGADYITFTSSSTVRYFLQAAGGAGAISPHSRLVSIGPATSATMREAGIEPHLEAERHDVDGVIAALLADVVDEQSAK